jgi:hypothetical protein
MSPLRSSWRFLWSLMLAALCTPVALLSWGAMRNGVDAQHGAMDIVRSTLSGLVVYGLSAEAAALVLGLPIYLFVRRTRSSSWLSYALIGGLISQMVNLLLAELGTLYFLTGRASKMQGFFDAVPVFLLCGISSALAFRALNGQGNE